MNYRSTLEVLKFAVPEEVAFHFHCVSSLWVKSVRSAELWWSFCQDLHIDDEYFAAFETPLEAYKSLKAAHFVVGVMWGNRLWWYDCQVRRFEKTMNVPVGVMVQNAQIVLLGDLSIVVVGGGKSGSTKAQRISRDGRIHPLPSISTSRKHFGLTNDTTRLYIFGGEHGATELSSSESLNLSNKSSLKKWISQGSMLSSRSHFSPAVYRNRVFLCGGGTTSCEFFDLQSRIFQAIDVVLHTKGPVSAVIFGEELILLTPDRNYGFNASNLTMKWSISHGFYEVCTALRPVIAHRSLYNVLNLNTIQIFAYPGQEEVREIVPEMCVGVKYTYDAKFNIVKVREPVAY